MILHKKIITYLALFLSILILALTGCQFKFGQYANNTSKAVTHSEISKKNSVINFSDPVIEAETRKILGKPNGSITKDDVLRITVFGDENGNNGKFGDICGSITTLTDLKWFKNLKKLVLSNCNIQDLTGIEELTNLQTLYIRRNNISSIEPVRNLINLVAFDCSSNSINDLSAVSKLCNLVQLDIGDNGNEYTDLSPLKNLTKLKSLYASWCGITDISALSDMKDLEYLQLFHNNISNITVLKNLQKVNYLDLSLNKISDISPLEGLSNSGYINLQDNLIPEDILNKYYEPKPKDYFTTTFHAKIKQNMPEFSFNLLAYYNKKTNGYSVKSITIINKSNGKTVQKISIPELTLFGNTNISDSDKKTMGFELEDLNFDGYKDIRLFDTLNGNYLEEWVYLVWNSKKYVFENDKRLNEISLANFDQSKNLIYGMVRGSAAEHYYSTYKYINGVPTLIRTFSQEYLNRDYEKIKKYLDKASIKTTMTDIMCFHETVKELNEKTTKMETIRDEYVFYPNSDVIEESHMIAKIDSSSKIGKIIKSDD